jgi:hypothetical protein
MDGGDDSAQCFPFLFYCCIPLQPPLVYTRKPKVVVLGADYQKVTIINIAVNSTDR